MQSQRIWECFPSSRLLSGNGTQFAMVTSMLLTLWAELLDISRELNCYHQEEHGFGKHQGNYGSCCGLALLGRASLAEKWGSMLVWVPTCASTAGMYSLEASSQLLGQHWPSLVLSGHLSSTCNCFTEGRTGRQWCCAWRNRENPSLTLASIVLTGYFCLSGRESFAYVLKSNCSHQSS